MKNSNLIKILLLTVILLTSNSNTYSKPPQNDSLEWKCVIDKERRKGWKVFKAKNSSSKFKQYKICGIIQCTPEQGQEAYMKLILDSTIRITKKGKSLGYVKVLDQTATELVVYDFMTGNFLAKDRDLVVRYKMYTDTSCDSKGVKWKQTEWQGYEENDSTIRMPLAAGSWNFERIDSTSSIATCSLQFHPGGNPPNWLVNMVVRSSIPLEFDRLRKLFDTNLE
jgi:hypothetical protein